MWRYRELFYFLTWRDIKVRYKQTAFGVAWAILQPLILMVVFSLFFGRVVGISSDGVPYPIFAYAGLLFWQFFSGSLSKASGSFVASQGILQKIYFPRLILPLSSTLVSLVDFAMAAVVFAGLMIYYQFVPTLLGILLVIPAILITVLTAAGLGTILATLNVKYRDVGHALPFFIQLLLFLTPVIYPVSLVPERFRWLLHLNPMTGVIDSIRASFLGLGDVNWGSLGTAFAISLFLFVFGYLYLRRFESEFADII
ncbi:MAG: ABC transporter permease [Candidatus Levyibacteriota bacterium]